MAVLQVFQAKLLHAIDESCLDLDALKELRSATNFSMCATKRTAQANDGLFCGAQSTTYG